MHKRVLLAFVGLQAFAFGQSVNLSIGSGSAAAGGTISLPIVLASSGGAQAAALQWSFSYSSDITGVTVVTGSSAAAAGKSVACSGPTCLVFGMNMNAIPDGTVATATFQIASAPSSTSIPIILAAVVTSTATGTAVLDAGGSGTISIAGIAGLACTSSTINTPGTSPCTVTLRSPAPSGGSSVPLSSNNANLTVPASVLVAGGQTAANFTVTAAQVSSNQTATLTAGTGSAAKTTTLTLAAPLQLTSLTCNPSTLGSNASSACAASLNKAASVATAISTSGSTGLTVAASATISAGQSSASFPVTTGTILSAQTASVTATLNGQSLTANIALGGLAQLTSLNCASTKLASGAATACTVSLSQPASNNLTIAISTSSPIAMAPPSVTASAGQSAVTFQITAGASGSRQLVTISASAGNSVQTSVSILPGNGPVHTKASVLGLYNAASYAPDQTCSPGSLATLAGAGFKPPGTQQAGVQVTLNGTDEPILGSTDTLIQFQCPVLSAGTQISLKVRPASGQDSEPLQFVLQEASPGLFSLSGTNQGAVLIAGTGDIAMTATDALPSRPAKRGEYLAIYANGLGPVEEVVPAGTLAPFDHVIQTTDQIVVGIGGVELAPSFAGLAPGLAGLYQVNVQLSEEVATGESVPVYVRVILGDGTILTSNTVTVAIQAADPLKQ